MNTVESFFVDCQNLAGSWGRNFVGNWLVITLLNIREDVNSWVRANQKLREHQTPTNNYSILPLATSLRHQAAIYNRNSLT